MILHVPHLSYSMPADARDQFVLSNGELATELLLMTDVFVDELFSWSGATAVKFALSRLVVDVERFPDDSEEPMSRVGMGAIYTRTAAGGWQTKLRRPAGPSSSTVTASRAGLCHAIRTNRLPGRSSAWAPIPRTRRRRSCGRLRPSWTP